MNANNQTPYPPYPPQSQAPQGRPPMPPQSVPAIRHTKNKFLTFMLALIPGGGQMYHGLMKKGVSLLILFFGTLAISVVTYLSVLNFLLPVIWFYSFFDAVNRMNMSVDEMRTLKDEYLFFGPTLPGTKPTPLNKLSRNTHIIIGVSLIALAVWICLNNLFFNSWYEGSFWAYIMSDFTFYAIRSFIQTLPTYILPVFCLIFGVKLILGSKDKKQGPQQPSDSVNLSDQ